MIKNIHKKNLFLIEIRICIYIYIVKINFQCMSLLKYNFLHKTIVS